MTKKVVLTAGPIPAKLDSVKIITNKFKGGLATITANYLNKRDFDLTVVKWEKTELSLTPDIEVVNVSDVESYVETVLGIEADAYILAAAVANLMPVSPWEGKFPSHKYDVGDTFDIKFTISPRLIDQIKLKYPKSTLIGYKLFDGSREELIEAGFKTLRNSKSNLVVCNSPSTAKKEKIIVTPDGSIFNFGFIEHLDFMIRAMNLEWYSTNVSHVNTDPYALSTFNEIIKNYGSRIFVGDEYKFGSIAVKSKYGTITTTRGKDGSHAKVSSVDFGRRIVNADTRATMNAPTMMRLLHGFNDANIVVHTHHKPVKQVDTFSYVFPGTTEEDGIPILPHFNVENHGQYVVFRDVEELDVWVRENLPKN